MSDLQGRRIPGEEGSSRKRWIWIVLGLLLLLLLAVLIPFACQSLTGGSGQQGDGGQGGDGSGAQSDARGGGQDDQDGSKAQKNAAAQNGATQSGAAQNGAARKGAANNDGTGSGGTQDGGDTAKRSGSGGPGAPRGGTVTRLSVRDQGGSGAAVTVPAATIEGTKGWVAIRADDGGKPGKVLGHAPLKAGANEGIKVELDRPVASSQRLYATVHTEAPADGRFTFPTGDPTATQGGRSAVQPISYTVDIGAPDQENAGIRDDELPESGGLPPAAVLATGTLLLASSLVGLSLALRRGTTSGI